MFDKLTLDEIDEEIDRTVDKLERLMKLREAVADQNQRRIRKLMAEYHAALRKQAGPPDYLTLAERGVDPHV
jgi:DnaJ-domain-containing protein 1